MKMDIGKGTIYSCGSCKKGSLGQREITTSRTPKKINRLHGVTKMACGLTHAVAITCKFQFYIPSNEVN